MGNTYYVDPGASGDDDGTSEANAWTSLQRAIDGTDGTQPEAGDIVYCKSAGSGDDEDLSAAIDMDGNEGSFTTGYVTYVGVNSSWVEDGTQYTIDGNGQNYCINWAAKDYIKMRNFCFRNATADGVNFDTNGASRNAFVNCRFTGCGSDGINAYRCLYGMFIGCEFDNNTSCGLYSDATGIFIFCSFHDNGEYGYEGGYSARSSFYGCLFFDNSYGEIFDVAPCVFNCVFDTGGDDNIRIKDYAPCFFFSRITNAPSGYYGVDAFSSNYLATFGWNYFQDNAAGDIDLNGLEELVNYRSSADTNQYDQGDTDDGYENLGAGTEDYRLASGATMRRDGIQIPYNAAI